MRARRRAALVACRFGRTRRHARRRVCGYLRGAAAARPLRCEPRLELCGRARRALCARLRRHGRDARRRVVLGCKARRRKEHGRAGQRGKERFHSSVSSGTADTTPGHYFIALIYYGRAAAEVPALHNLNIVACGSLAPQTPAGMCCAPALPDYIAFTASGAVFLEGWPSGLRRTLGKRVYGKPYRGFESHSLRQSRM